MFQLLNMLLSNLLLLRSNLHYITAQKNSGFARKNAKPFSYQDQISKPSPTHSYHDNLRRWGGYGSSGETPQDTLSNNPIRSRGWSPGVGRGRHRRGNNPTRAGGGKMMGGPVSDGGGGGRYRNRNTGSWAEDYPRPRPPPVQSYMGGIRQSQLVRSHLPHH